MRNYFIFKYLFFLCFISLISTSCKDRHVDFSSKETIIVASFVGSHTCKECHEKEYDLWMGSHHQLAMQEADSLSVLGNFNNAEFESRGVKYRFFKSGKDYMVNTIGETGNYQDFSIKYVFGIIPLQQYIIEFKNGNHQCLLSAWDSDSLKWFDLQPNLDLHHEEWMHWTGGSMTWNNMCADCHSTFVQKNYNADLQTYKTTFTEINVSCEACHGPSDMHNLYYENEEKYKDQVPPKFYMPNYMKPEELVQKCARCHSRRAMLTKVFDYDGHFLDHYNPNLLRYPTYELDGQILDEDYVYASFMQSKMFHNKISCRDCHDMHSLALKKEGNDLCLMCHLPSYNTFEHHFHKMDTEASQCVNCHMTGRYYMGNDFRRDHSFRNPRPDQSMVYETPNACNACHDDKSIKWAAEFIKKKYGKERLKHFTNWLLPGLAGNMDSLTNLIKRNDFPEIIRATAVNALAERVGSMDDVDLLKVMMKDSSALVRREAILALSSLDIDLKKEIEPILSDSIRLVRIAAARYFLLNNIETDKPAFAEAKEEFFTDLEVNADFASGQHQKALYHQSKGEVEACRNAYERAIEIDNFYNMSRMNLALLEYENGDVGKAEKLYKKVIEQESGYSYPYFMLGLLYHEQKQPEKSLEYLEKATQKDPFILRAYYNYALKLQEKGSFGKADKVLDRGLVFRMDENLLYVKLVGKIKQESNKEAVQICEQLLSIAPDNQDYLQILNDLKK